MRPYESPVYNFETQSEPLGLKPVLRWLLIAVAWAVLGVIYAAPIYVEVRSEGMNHSAWRIFSWGILTWLAWAPLTPFIVWLARRFSLIGYGWKRNLPLNIVAFICASVLHSAAATAVTLSIRPFDDMGDSKMEFWPRFVGRAKGAFGADLLVYGAIVGICYSVDYYRKYREREVLATQLEAQLAQAQLDSLRMQLHPHFLFNTLNGIVGLVRDHENEAAVNMLVGLSDLLRHALEHSDQQEVELREELEFIKLYLNIQQMRFCDRLQLEFNIDPGTMKALVPNLILQPLAENALRHGISRKLGSGTVRISSTIEDGSLRLSVYDNGAGLPDDWQLKSSCGIGLANTVARLQQLYNDNHSLDISNRDEGGVEVVIVMPLKIRF
jgi:two-component system LytT family sensor kinase